MRITNLLPLATILVGMTSCQFNYTFPDPDAHNERSVQHTGHHGAAMAYRDSVNAVMLARDLTDEELMEGADALPGNGYRDSNWASENPDELAFEVFECDDGGVFILDDEGNLIFIEKSMCKDDGAAYNNGCVCAQYPEEIMTALHFFEGKDGKKYIFDDETGDLQEFLFGQVTS